MPVLLCLLLAAVSFDAIAANEPSFRKLDRDRDGQLSALEVATLQLDFHALDTDGNGYLSRGEIDQAEIPADEHAAPTPGRNAGRP